MAIDLLAVRNAKQHVQSYAQEFDVMACHKEAMDCRNCESFLQMGIDAFEWMIRADRAVRMAIYRGDKDFDPDFEVAMSELCKSWLKPCEFAESWIAIQLERGYEIDNLSEFRHCVEEMTAIIEANEEGAESLPDSIAHLRDAAVEEHRNGQASEFV